MSDEPCLKRQCSGLSPPDEVDGLSPPDEVEAADVMSAFNVTVDADGKGAACVKIHSKSSTTMLRLPETPLCLMLIDQSGSMRQQCHDENSRWEHALKAVEHYFSIADGIETGVILFNHNAYLLAPSSATHDPKQIAALLASVTPTGGTYFDKALSEALRVSQPAREAKRPVVFFFVTDGEDESGLIDKMKKAQKEDPLLKALRNADRLSMHCVAIGHATSLVPLRILSSYPCKSGEVAQIEGNTLSSVVGALVAIIRYSVPYLTHVHIEGSQMPTVSSEVTLQMCAPEVETKVSFFVPVGTFAVRVEIEGTTVFTGTYAAEELPVCPDAHYAQDAASLVKAMLVRDIEYDMEQQRFESAIKKVNQKMESLRTRTGVESALNDLNDLRRQISEIGEEVKAASFADTERGASYHYVEMMSHATHSMRAISGAPPLTLPDNSTRTMSRNAQRLSSE